MGLAPILRCRVSGEKVNVAERTPRIFEPVNNGVARILAVSLPWIAPVWLGLVSLSPNRGEPTAATSLINAPS